MTLFFPTGIQLASEGLISIKRIQEFLLVEEVNETGAVSSSEVFEQGPKLVKRSGVCGRWKDQNGGNTLEDISFDSGSGKLAAIIGAVGSGKSSILNAILGELPITNGKIKLVGKIG